MTARQIVWWPMTVTTFLDNLAMTFLTAEKTPQMIEHDAVGVKIAAAAAQAQCDIDSLKASLRASKSGDNGHSAYTKFARGDTLPVLGEDPDYLPGEARDRHERAVENLRVANLALQGWNNAFYKHDAGQSIQIQISVACCTSAASDYNAALTKLSKAIASAKDAASECQGITRQLESGRGVLAGAIGRHIESQPLYDISEQVNTAIKQLTPYLPAKK